MGWLLYSLMIVLLVVVLLDALATCILARTGTLSRLQLCIHALTIWLVPVLGALFVISLFRDAEPDALPRSLVRDGWIKSTLSVAIPASNLGGGHHGGAASSHGGCSMDGGGCGGGDGS